MSLHLETVEIMVDSATTLQEEDICSLHITEFLQFQYLPAPLAFLISFHALTFFLPPHFFSKAHLLCVSVFFFCLFLFLLSPKTHFHKTISDSIKAPLTCCCCFFPRLFAPPSRENWKQNESRSRNQKDDEKDNEKKTKSLRFPFACVADTLLPAACWLFLFSYLNILF